MISGYNLFFDYTKISVNEICRLCTSSRTSFCTESRHWPYKTKGYEKQLGRPTVPKRKNDISDWGKR